MLPPPSAYATSSARDSAATISKSHETVFATSAQVTEHLHRAATVIQAAWRGYSVRSIHPQCASVRREMRTRRMESHILLLESEVRRCHARLQEQEELRVLQHEALAAVWNQVGLWNSLRIPASRTLAIIACPPQPPPLSLSLSPPPFPRSHPLHTLITAARNEGT